MCSSDLPTSGSGGGAAGSSGNGSGVTAGTGGGNGAAGVSGGSAGGAGSAPGGGGSGGATSSTSPKAGGKGGDGKLIITYYTPSISSPSVASLTGFAYNTSVGGPSAQQSFTISASYLTANLVLTAPTDYEISSTSGSGFGSSVTLTPTSGSVASTTIYVRLKSGLSAAD